jgi:hypothetical protein
MDRLMLGIGPVIPVNKETLDDIFEQEINEAMKAEDYEEDNSYENFLSDLPKY